MGAGYWPAAVRRTETVEAFIEAYRTLGFERCADGSLEAGIEKIALFGKTRGRAAVPTHAALQLESGQWTSKLGGLEDINHLTVDAVAGPLYGAVLCYLARPRNTAPRTQP